MPTPASSPLVNSLSHHSNASAINTPGTDAHLSSDHDYSVYHQQLASSGGGANSATSTGGVRNDSCMYNQSLNSGTNAAASMSSKDHMYDPQKKPSLPPLIGNATTAASVVGTATTGGLFGYGPSLPHCHPHYRPRDGTMFVLGDVKSTGAQAQSSSQLNKSLEMGNANRGGVANNQVTGVQQHHLNSVAQVSNKSITDSSSGVCSATPYDYLYHSNSPYGYIDTHSAHLMAGGSGGDGNVPGGVTNFLPHSHQSYYGARDKSNSSAAGAGSYSMIPTSAAHQATAAHLMGQHHPAAAATSFYYDYSAAYDSHQAAMLAAVAASYPRSTFLPTTASHYHLMPVPNPPSSSAGATRSSSTITAAGGQQSSSRGNQHHHHQHNVQDMSNSAAGGITAATNATTTASSRSPFTSQTPTISQQLSGLGQTGKRPRGRPRKHPLPISTHLQQQQSSSASAAAAAAKRQSSTARQAAMAAVAQDEHDFSKDQSFGSSLNNTMNNGRVSSPDAHQQQRQCLSKQLSFDLEYLSGLYTPATLSELKLLNTSPSDLHTEVAEEYIAIGEPFNRLSLATYTYEVLCKDLCTDSVVSLVQQKLGKLAGASATKTAAAAAREDKSSSATASLGSFVGNKHRPPGSRSLSIKKSGETENDEDEDMQDEKAGRNNIDKKYEGSNSYFHKTSSGLMNDVNYITDDNSNKITELNNSTNSNVDNNDKTLTEQERLCKPTGAAESTSIGNEASGNEISENYEQLGKDEHNNSTEQFNATLKEDEKDNQVNSDSTNNISSDYKKTVANEKEKLKFNSSVIVSKMKERVSRLQKVLAFNLNTSFIWSSLNPKIPVRDLVISRYHMSALLNNSRVLVFRHQTHPLIRSMVDQWDYIEELDNQRIVAIRIVSGLLPQDWRRKYHEFMRPKLAQQIQQDLLQRQTEKTLLPSSSLLLAKLSKLTDEHATSVLEDDDASTHLSSEDIKLLMLEHQNGILCSSVPEPDWLPEPFILAAIDQCGSIRFVKCCGYHNYPSFVVEEQVATGGVAAGVTGVSTKELDTQLLQKKSQGQPVKPNNSNSTTTSTTNAFYSFSDVKQQHADPVDNILFTLDGQTPSQNVVEGGNPSPIMTDDDESAKDNINHQCSEDTFSVTTEPSSPTPLVRIEYRHNHMNRVGRPLDLAIPASKQRVQVQDVALGEITEESLFVDSATAPEVAMVIYATIPGSQEHSVFIKGRNIYIRFKNFPAGPAKLFCGPLGHTGALLLTNGTVWCWSTQTRDEQQKPKGKIAVSIRQVGGSLNGCHVIDLVALGPEFLALTSDGVVHEWNNYTPYLKSNQESCLSIDTEISLPYCITRPIIPEPIELTPDFQKRILSHARSSQPEYKVGNFHWFTSVNNQRSVSSEVKVTVPNCIEKSKTEEESLKEGNDISENKNEQQAEQLDGVGGVGSCGSAVSVNSVPPTVVTSSYLSEDILEWQRQAEIKRLYLNDKNDLIERLYFTEGVTMFLYGNSGKFTYIENHLNQYRHASHPRWQRSDELFMLMHEGFSQRHAQTVLDQIELHQGKPLTMNPVVVARMRLPTQHELSDNQLRQQLEYMATNSTSYRLLLSPTSIIVATLKQINLMEEIKRSLVKHIPVGIAGFHPSFYADSFTGFSPLYMGLTQDELKQLLRYLIEGEKRYHFQTQTRRSKGRVGRPKGSRTALRSSLSNRNINKQQQFLLSKDFDEENDTLLQSSSKSLCGNLFGRLSNFSESFPLSATTTQRPWELILNLLEFDSSRKRPSSNVAGGIDFQDEALVV